MSHRFKARPLSARFRRQRESQAEFDVRRGIQATVTDQRQLEVYLAQIGRAKNLDQQREMQRAVLTRITPWLKFTPAPIPFLEGQEKTDATNVLLQTESESII